MTRTMTDKQRIAAEHNWELLQLKGAVVSLRKLISVYGNCDDLDTLDALELRLEAASIKKRIKLIEVLEKWGG